MELKPRTNAKTESLIKQHAETIQHDTHPSYGEILEWGAKNKQKCLFLESFHRSMLEPNVANEMQHFSRVYMPFMSALK